MKKCKYLREEKCVDCGLCEPAIELTGEQAENLIKIADDFQKGIEKVSDCVLGVVRDATPEEIRSID